MRIQHNIMSMNAYRNYNTNTGALSKNLEKLSSGYKINRAGDDAAGLAISEKMRAQITGLETAQKNAKDGISLVQTAEGALTEVHDMLNRMVELATQSSNGTYSNTTDRENLQKEVDQLRSEINRIADSANFNGINLLDGSLDSKVTSTVADLSFGDVSGATAKQGAQTAEFKIDLTGFAMKNNGSTATTLTASFTIGGQKLSFKAAAVDGGKEADASKFKTTTTSLTIDGVTWNITGSNMSSLVFKADAKTDYDKKPNAAKPTFEVKVNGGTGVISGSVYNTRTQTLKTGQNEKAAQVGKVVFNLTKDMMQNGAQFKIGDKVFTLDFTADYKVTDVAGGTIGVKDLLKEDGTFDESKLDIVGARITRKTQDGNLKVGYHDGKIEVTTRVFGTTTASKAAMEKYDTLAEMKDLVSVTTSKGGTPLELQIGDTSDGFNQLSVSIQDIHTSSLGIKNISIAKQDDAQAAVSVIKEAINKVSGIRGTLGATQNRLDHTINNLSVMTENIQDAESTIRDTDVAEEMMSYTKNNILVQSAQAMLAQANQVPQGVLQLLQ